MVRLLNKVIFPLLLLASFGRCQQMNPPQGFLDASPDFVQPCAVLDKCDDSECIETFGENSTAFGAGFHKYLVDQWGDDDATFGAQYYICACNFKSNQRKGGSVRFVQADSICKLNEYRIPIPEDSYEPCPGDNDDCHRYCNDVTFEAWEEANKFPEGAGGVGPVASSIDSGNCECFWNEEPIVGCTYSEPSSEPSSPPSTGETSGDTPVFVTAGLALAAFATAVGIEARNFF